jgi:hypothetical protein
MKTIALVVALVLCACEDPKEAQLREVRARHDAWAAEHKEKLAQADREAAAYWKGIALARGQQQRDSSTVVFESETRVVEVPVERWRDDGDVARKLEEIRVQQEMQDLQRRTEQLLDR